MMRICYMVDAPFLGGAERYVSRLAGALDPRGFEASLVVRASDAGDAMDRWADDLAARGYRVARVPMRLPYRPHDAVAIHNVLAALSPQVVHVNMPGPYDGQMALLAPIARMAGASAVVTTEHLPMVRPLWKRALVKRVAYRAVDAVVTVCGANVPFLVGAQSVPPDKVRVVHNGIRANYGSAAAPRSETRLRYTIPDDAVLVVFVGNLLHHKGLHRVIEAMSHVEGRWHLAVAGTGPEEVPCRALLESVGLAERATFLGALSSGDVESLLGAADILTLPSTIEGLPYVILEAMASGVAVVAGAVYGIPEMIDDGVHGFLVEPADRAALAHALARLVNEPQLRVAMGSAARARFLAEFTLERQARTMEDLYRELAGRRHVVTARGTS
jgi:glycosyltransferase involved in cell wall biosynthesis